MSVIDNIRQGKYHNDLPAKHDWNSPDWQKHYDAYIQEDFRLNRLFRDDLEEEFQTTTHPKRSILFARAWQYGQAYGLLSVYDYYTDLHPLIKD